MRLAHVAGRGAVSGFGRGRRALVDGVFAGGSALRPRARTAAFAVATGVAAELPAGCVEANGGDADEPLVLAAALAAATEALAEAGEPDRRRLGLVLASTKADLAGIVGDGDGLGSPMRLCERLASRLSLGGERAAVSCACASGLLAVGMAARRLAAGSAERVLVVGVDVLTEFVMAGFAGMHALDAGACRPFDRSRRGISLGEGAGALLLSALPKESLGVAVAGHAGANDACHVTGPDREGTGIGLAALRAIAAAGLAPADLDVLHLHGTGTLANDSTEAIGLARAFGGRTPPAFGSKAQTGHTLGAAGLLELLISAEALDRRSAPANVGLVEPDVDPGLDLVRAARSLPRARAALKVASGFGGVQAAVVLRA